MGAPLRPRITREGQAYFDKEVHVLPKLEKQPSILELSVAAAFNGGEVPQQLVKKPLMVGHDRQYLRWMTPDNRGGLRQK